MQTAVKSELYCSDENRKNKLVRGATSHSAITLENLAEGDNFFSDGRDIKDAQLRDIFALQTALYDDSLLLDPQL